MMKPYCCRKRFRILAKPDCRPDARDLVPLWYLVPSSMAVHTSSVRLHSLRLRTGCTGEPKGSGNF
jgi:hypothetical protein